MCVVKKTSLMILVALALVSGASAYAYTEGVFDQILELTEDETEVVESVVEEEPCLYTHLRAHET